MSEPQPTGGAAAARTPGSGIVRAVMVREGRGGGERGDGGLMNLDA